MEYADGRLDVAAIRLLVVPSRQWAPQAAVAYAAAHAKEAARVTAPVRPVAARGFAWAAEAAAAIAEDEGWGQGRRGRTPRPWRQHVLHARVEAVHVPHKRSRRGRPPQAEAPQGASRSRLRGPPEALVPAADAHGWTVLATTGGPEKGTDAEVLQAYQEQHIPVAPGLRWRKHPAAISPVWREQPERIAALARLTVVGFLG